MVHDTIDIERCVWDPHYRHKVKRLLNCQPGGGAPTANQNRGPLPSGKNKLPVGTDLHQPS